MIAFWPPDNSTSAAVQYIPAMSGSDYHIDGMAWDCYTVYVKSVDYEAIYTRTTM